MNELIFRSCNKSEWIKNSIEYRESITPAIKEGEVVNIHLLKDVVKEKFEPMHIVLFSCLIDVVKTNKYKVRLIIDNEELRKFVWEDIKVKEYWSGKNIAHIPSPVPSRFNLWRILEDYKDSYAINVCQYLKRLDNGKDFSGFQTTINELYYNIFDHAEANGNAFSYISADIDERSISVAVCDFGKGIARTLREAHPEYDTDEKALMNAIKRGVTSRSKSHNAGLGLYNIVSMLQNDDSLRIISNNSLAVYVGNSKRFYKLERDFKGTLIYLRMSIDSWAEEEIVESFCF